MRTLQSLAIMVIIVFSGYQNHKEKLKNKAQLKETKREQNYNK